MSRRCPKSEVWKYFVQADSLGATCNVCFKFVKGSSNTSNYHKHLKTHGISFEKSANKQLNGSIFPTTHNESSPNLSSNPSSKNHNDSIGQPEPSNSASSTSVASNSVSSPRPLTQPKLRNFIENQLSFASKKKFPQILNIFIKLHSWNLYEL